MIRLAAFLSVVLLTPGCAGLSVHPVTDEATDKGIRYYQTAPFLFVRSDGKGGLTSEIVYLPDTTLPMSIRPYAYLASNDTTLSFSNGTLGEAKMVGDETVVPTAIVDAISKVASAAIAADSIAADGTATVPVPYLFKIVIEGSQIRLLGGPAKDANGKAKINVIVVPGAPK